MSRWRHRHLVAAWAAYWVALVGVKLGGAIIAIFGVTGPRGHGSASGSFGDNGVTFTVINGASTAWTGTSTFAAIALWVAGPPLALWLVWMLSRPKRGARHALEAPSLAAVDAGRQRELGAPPESYGEAVRRDELHDGRPRE